MDTIPFHLILFALDVVVFGGLFLWIRLRANTGSVHSNVHHFEKSLYAPTVTRRRPSLAWDLFGVFLFGGFGLVCLAILCGLITTDYVQNRIYYFNVGQCVVEGFALHGILFLCVAAVLLFWNRRCFLAVCFVCLAMLLAVFSFRVLYWEPYNLKVEHYEIRTPKITKSLRIVFVSDIQTDRVGFHEINTIKKIQEQKADLIILGGDYIQTFRDTQEKRLRKEFRQLLLDYPLEAPMGVYALPGNIGWEGDAAMFEDTSIEYDHRTKILLGEIKDWDPPIDLVLLSIWHGVGGPGERGITSSDNFIVMAGHRPNYAIDGYTNPETGKQYIGYRNTERAPDLMLAGHTHGGQIVLPFYGPVHIRSDKTDEQIPRNMKGGFFAYPNGGHLLISRGSGLERGWAPRVRLFCPAEISVIDIIPE